MTTVAKMLFVWEKKWHKNVLFTRASAGPGFHRFDGTCGQGPFMAYQMMAVSHLAFLPRLELAEKKGSGLLGLGMERASPEMRWFDRARVRRSSFAAGLSQDWAPRARLASSRLDDATSSAARDPRESLLFRGTTVVWPLATVWCKRSAALVSLGQPFLANLASIWFLSWHKQLEW